MKIKGKYHVKHALIVNQESLQKIILILNNFFPNAKMSFTATLKNDADVRFDSAEELYLYDNVGDYRILVLSLETEKYSSYRLIFNSRHGDNSYFIKWVAVISYHLDDKMKIISLEAQLKDAFQEMKPAFLYNLISIIPFTPFRTIIVIYWALYFIFNWYENIVFIIPTIVIVIWTFFDIFQKSLFPSLQFAIGKGVGRIKNRENVRKALVGLVVGIITVGGTILSLLKT